LRPPGPPSREGPPGPRPPPPNRGRSPPGLPPSLRGGLSLGAACSGAFVSSAMTLALLRILCRARKIGARDQGLGASNKLVDHTRSRTLIPSPCPLAPVFSLSPGLPLREPVSLPERPP